MTTRWEKAVEAFQKTLNRSLEIQNPTGSLRSEVVGFLRSEDDSAITPLSLRSGRNHFINEKDGVKIIQSSENLSSVAATIIAMPGKIDIVAKEDSLSAVHGDSVKIANKKFKIYLLSARTMGKWLMSMSILLMLSTSVISAAVYPLDGQITLSAGSEETIDISIPGLTRFPAESKAVLKTSAGQKEISISSVKRTPLHIAVLVDTSNLCVMRKMESALDRQIRDFLLSLDRDTVVSLVEFYRSKPGEKDFTNRFVREDPRTILKKEDSIVRCRDDVTSLNALDAIQRVQKDIFSQGERGKMRQAMVVLSAGNIQENSDIKRLLQEKKMQVVSVVYSSIPLGQAENILSDLARINRGSVRWWKPGEKTGEEFSLAAVFPHSWTLGLRSYLFDLPSDKYSLEIQIPNGENRVLVTAQVRHIENKTTGFLYYFFITLVLIGILSLIGYIVYRLIRYYQVPLCAIHKKPISRAWNKCLLCAEGKEGVFFIQDKEGIKKAYVILNGRVSIGPRFRDNIRIRQGKFPVSLLVEQVGDQTFKLSSRNNSQSYVLNSLETRGSINLRNGDQISLGDHLLQFHFSGRPNLYA